MEASGDGRIGDAPDAFVKLVDEWLRDAWPRYGFGGEPDFEKMVTRFQVERPELWDAGGQYQVRTAFDWVMLMSSRAARLGYYHATTKHEYRPEQYFDEDKGKLMCGILGRDIAHHERLLYLMDREGFYYPNNGIYKEGGDVYVRNIVAGVMAERTVDVKNSHMTEILFQVQMHSFGSYERDFCHDIRYIPVLNGVLDVETRELFAYDLEKWRFLFKLPVTYDPTADCPNFRQFLSEVLYADDIPIIQELFGYCLWRDYYIKKAFMFTGTGDNGKSLLIHVLETFLGRDNYCSVGLTDIAESTFAVASLKDKLANIYGDLTDRAVKDTGAFKMLTGGDSLKYEEKYKAPSHFVNYAKLIFATNAPPDARDDTEAYFTRWCIISFPYTFVNLPPEMLVEGQKPAKPADGLKAQLTSQSELSGILNWALEGLVRLRREGRFSNSKSTEEIRHKLIRMSNSLKAFIDECCTVSVGLVMKKNDFYKAYIEFCDKNQLTKKDASVVGREIRMLHSGIESGNQRFDGRLEHVWRGIDLTRNLVKEVTTPATNPDQKSLDEAETPKPQSPPKPVAPAVSEAEKETTQARLDALVEKYGATRVEWAVKRMVQKKWRGETITAYALRVEARELGEPEAEVVRGMVDLHFIDLAEIVDIIHRRRLTENDPQTGSPRGAG